MYARKYLLKKKHNNKNPYGFILLLEFELIGTQFVYRSTPKGMSVMFFKNITQTLFFKSNNENANNVKLTNVNDYLKQTYEKKKIIIHVD